MELLSQRLACETADRTSTHTMRTQHLNEGANNGREVGPERIHGYRRLPSQIHHAEGKVRLRPCQAAPTCQRRLLRLRGRRRALQAVVQHVHRRVLAAERHELVVRPLLDEAALAQHRDRLRVPDRAQLVRDCDRRHRPLRDHVVQRTLHLALALVVQRARRLVEQQDARLPQDGACDRHTLLLPTRQTAALRAHLRVVALRQVLDHTVDVRQLRSLVHLRHRRVGLAQADVLQHRHPEQRGLLRHHTHLRPPPLQVHVRQVHTVHVDLARCQLVEPLQQRHHRRLAAARPADQAHVHPLL
eukprot:Rhum_TRINITY_DN15029_c3_g1::Rhum_TRINITY_DN15029_c3_g1_i1::g.135270::m.135270